MKTSDPLNHLGSIWYHSEPLEVPYSPNQFLGWDFFCRFLQQTISRLEKGLLKVRAGPNYLYPYKTNQILVKKNT